MSKHDLGKAHDVCQDWCAKGPERSYTLEVNSKGIGVTLVDGADGMNARARSFARTPEKLVTEVEHYVSVWDDFVEWWTSRPIFQERQARRQERRAERKQRREDRRAERREGRRSGEERSGE